MQKAIAKYGLAAHLALLAVAPLFMFPFASAGAMAAALLWLSVPAYAWTFLQPSVMRGEMLHDARARVASAVFRDPLFWAFTVVCVFAGLRALNSGVALTYDAETAAWKMSEPPMQLMPASAGDAGFLPFAAAVAASAIAAGCRHALGKSARQAYFLVSSALAGAAATIALCAWAMGWEEIPAVASAAEKTMSFAGCAFGIHFAGGIAAAAAAVESRWNRAMPFLVFSVGGTAAGVFAFAPPVASAIFAVAAVPLFLYCFLYSMFVVKSTGEFKFMVLFAFSLACGGALAFATMPPAAMSSRLAAFADFALLPDGADAASRILSGVAVKSWMRDPWLGTGLGTFALDMRFEVLAKEWALLPRGIAAPLGAWPLALAERGTAGCAALALPFAFLAFTYARRLGQWIARAAGVVPQPLCWAGPVALAAAAATGFFDCSCLRADALLAALAAFSVSAGAFPKARKG